MKRNIFQRGITWSMTKFPLLYRLLSDEKYLKLKYKALLGSDLNLKNPQTFNEKLQWLKLHDRKPEYIRMVDKYEAKKYVAEKIGEEYIIPTLGVWDKFDDINFDLLPDRFVLKCTHDSGGLVVVRDKSHFDIKAARKKINKSLKRNYYWSGREWPYKNVKPRIIAEKYMEDDRLRELRDYKFFCFGGMAKCFKVDFDRFVEHHANYYDKDKNLLNLGEKICPPIINKTIELPKTLDAMKDFSEKLSKEIPFLRCDFYDVNGEVYFGEMTFYPAGGFGAFTSKEWDEKLGSWINLPGGGYFLVDHDFIVCLRKSQEISGLIDYKFYCFNGEPKFLYISSGLENHRSAHISFVNLDWTFAPYERGDYKPFEALPPKPLCFDEMLKKCKILSEGQSFLRVDLYQINNKVYFSELTFSPCSGFMPFKDEASDYNIGKLIQLPMAKGDRNE